MDDRSDDTLIELAREPGPAGDLAFRTLVRRHQDGVVRTLYHLLGSLDEAHDVAQDAFVKAYTSLDSYRGPDRFGAWLRRIATRLAFNRRRDRTTRRRHEDTAPGPLASPSPFRAVAAKEVVDEVLGRLPYPYREILVLRYVDELELAELADTLDLGLSAVKMRLLRARTKFQEAFHEVVDAT